MEDRKYSTIYIFDEDAEVLECMAEKDSMDQATVIHTLLKWYGLFCES